MLHCYYEDEELLVVEKPAGVDSQEANALSEDMVSYIRNYLCHRNLSCGNVFYVGVVHRLDKPVRGVMVYAKTREAAAVLSRQAGDTTGKQMKKEYYALVLASIEGEQYLAKHPSGTLTDDMLFQKKGNVSVIVSAEEKKKLPTLQQKEVRQAVLDYTVADLSEFDGFDKNLELLKQILSPEEQNRLHLLRIDLKTGRHHQIRLQLSHIGCPIIGDRKYNALLTDDRPGARMLSLCLCAARLSFLHPKTGKRMEFWLNQDE